MTGRRWVATMGEMQPHPHLLAVAPMMDWTDRHFRFLVRQISKGVRLYTEMVTAAAIEHGHRPRLLDFSPEEQPLTLQLGGSDPALLARAAQIGQAWGYADLNLNLGCPSPRVQKGAFGACLMLDPQRVAECVVAMRQSCRLPVTAKHRLGVDEVEDYAYLARFVATLAEAGVEVFVVHARKAWLKGLSPRQNREIPPLRYPWVYQLKQDFPHLTVILNGGLRSLAEAATHLGPVDGVMMGRAIYEDPYRLAPADEHWYGLPPAPSREAVARMMLPYLENQMYAGVRFWNVARHLLNLYRGQPGGARFRRVLAGGGAAENDPRRLEWALAEVDRPLQRSQ